MLSCVCARVRVRKNRKKPVIPVMSAWIYLSPNNFHR